MKEISIEERELVLLEVGMRTVREAIKGICTFGKPSARVNFEAAELWVKDNAHDINASKELLRITFLGQLKNHAIAGLREYEFGDISAEDRRHVLSEVGMIIFRGDADKRGMLYIDVSSNIVRNVIVNWSEAAAWSTLRALELRVPEKTLRIIMLEYLRQRAIEEIEKYQ
ncbi:MAG: hypothetical protein HGA36_03420 [Candidatus Moranbacteria bacterium]|nr:hypothetical protein [Candidatus Moranbacteria bacterium]